MLENGRGLIKALENWAKKVTSGYKDVNVRDLSTSFRDGLAFCAIVHHYRPDLIDFDSLSKENIFENNSLAFSVAEKQLGVPALLDAEDMVKYSHPDRLSIITYLSQLRNCFENQNKVNKRPDLKRIQSNSSGPPPKLPVLQTSLTSIKRHEVCQMCKHRVFILERLIVDGKLYHTTCFRCHKCNALLNPGAYIESDTPGVYECSVCLLDETFDTSESFMDTSESAAKQKIEEPVVQAMNISQPVFVPEKDFSNTEVVNFAKSNLSQDDSGKTNLLISSLKSSESYSPELKHSAKNKSDISISVRDKISVFEKNQVLEKSPSPTHTPVPKPRQSLLSSKETETEYSPISNTFSIQQSSISTKSFENSNTDTENKRLSQKAFLAKDFAQKDFSLQEKTHSNERASKDFDIKKCEDICDSATTDSNTSLHKISDSDSKISLSPTKDLSRDKDTFSVKTDSESSSKVTRDIFKSSLPPLKLSLPSSIRREPVTAPEVGKAFDIPQIKSSYSATLPRPGLGQGLSTIKQTSDFKPSISESSLKNDTKLQDSKIVRRSSLESSRESNKDDNTSLENNSKIFLRPNSSNELSSQNEKDDSKDNSKTYAPIYKSIYNSSSLLSNYSLTSRLGADNSDVKAKSTSEINREGNQFNFKRSVSSLTSEKSPDNSDVKPKSTSEINREGNQFNFKRSVSLLTSEKSPDAQPSILSQEGVNISAKKDLTPIEAESKDSTEETYPDDLNPFGDEEEEEDKEEYPDDLNPFGDEEEEEVIDNSKISVEDYDESKNPFASDEEEDETTTTQNTTYLPKPHLTESKTSNFNDSICSNVSSPTSSLKGTIKKRPAPRPPKVSEIFPKDSVDSGIDSSFSSVKSSPSLSKKNFQTSSPKVRKNKPAPPPPPTVPDLAASVKMTKESDNMKLKSSMQKTEDNQPPKQFKKKKRPAPPVPIPMRRDKKKIPLKEIIQEMKEIEEKQREYERQGREIELLIRDRDKDEEPSVEEEEYIMQLFELVNQKNALFRRQAELMYIKRSQRLEEQQHQVEKEIRFLMDKPESEKTDEDRQKEEELTMELIDIVDQRNSIIDSIEMDRRRELEEDHSVQEQLEIKNGDLPITAEIKQKSGKVKKSKAKKEKKKHAEEESGKGTLKKKKHLFSKRS